MDYIEYENLGKLNKFFFEDYKRQFDKTINSGWYVLGKMLQILKINMQIM